MSRPAGSTGQDTGDLGQTVPDALIGCWRRNWIRFGDGARESDVVVFWLQTKSGMCDIRIDASKPPEASDSSCGITVVDGGAERVTADWLHGKTGFAQQAVPSFPEKGWLRWESDTILRECAPSGAYEEEWELLEGSTTGPVEHLTARGTATTTNLYVAGQHVMFASERGPDALVSEFSYGLRSSDSDGVEEAGIQKGGTSQSGVIVAVSTIAERVGQPMNLDLDWRAAAD